MVLSKAIDPLRLVPCFSSSPVSWSEREADTGRVGRGPGKGVLTIGRRALTFGWRSDSGGI